MQCWSVPHLYPSRVPLSGGGSTSGGTIPGPATLRTSSSRYEVLSFSPARVKIIMSLRFLFLHLHAPAPFVRPLPSHFSFSLSFSQMCGDHDAVTTRTTCSRHGKVPVEPKKSPVPVPAWAVEGMEATQPLAWGDGGEGRTGSGFGRVDSCTPQPLNRVRDPPLLGLHHETCARPETSGGGGGTSKGGSRAVSRTVSRGRSRPGSPQTASAGSGVGSGGGPSGGSTIAGGSGLGLPQRTGPSVRPDSPARLIRGGDGVGNGVVGGRLGSPIHGGSGRLMPGVMTGGMAGGMAGGMVGGGKGRPESPGLPGKGRKGSLNLNLKKMVLGGDEDLGPGLGTGKGTGMGRGPRGPFGEDRAIGGSLGGGLGGLGGGGGGSPNERWGKVQASIVAAAPVPMSGHGMAPSAALVPAGAVDKKKKEEEEKKEKEQEREKIKKADSGTPKQPFGVAAAAGRARAAAEAAAAAAVEKAARRHLGLQPVRRRRQRGVGSGSAEGTLVAVGSRVGDFGGDTDDSDESSDGHSGGGKLRALEAKPSALPPEVADAVKDLTKRDWAAWDGGCFFVCFGRDIRAFVGCYLTAAHSVAAQTCVFTSYVSLCARYVTSKFKKQVRRGPETAGGSWRWLRGASMGCSRRRRASCTPGVTATVDSLDRGNWSGFRQGKPTTTAMTTEAAGAVLAPRGRPLLLPAVARWRCHVVHRPRCPCEPAAARAEEAAARAESQRRRVQ